jgi:hypothetical protein
MRSLKESVAEMFKAARTLKILVHVAYFISLLCLIGAACCGKDYLVFTLYYFILGAVTAIAERAAISSVNKVQSYIKWYEEG